MISPYEYGLIRFCRPFAQVVKTSDYYAFGLLFRDSAGIRAFYARYGVCFGLFYTFFDDRPENGLNGRELLWRLVPVRDHSGVHISFISTSPTNFPVSDLERTALSSA